MKRLPPLNGQLELPTIRTQAPRPELDAAIEKRAKEQTKAESDASIKRLSQKYAPKKTIG